MNRPGFVKQLEDFEVAARKYFLMKLFPPPLSLKDYPHCSGFIGIVTVADLPICQISSSLMEAGVLVLQR